MSDRVTIEGFDHIIREAAAKRIEASIAEALKTQKDGIVERVVRVAMEAKVKDGYREIPFLEKLARDTIQDATRDVVKEWVESIVPDIKAELESLLATKKAQRDLASAMLGQLVRVASMPRWSIKVAFEEPGND